MAKLAQTSVKYVVNAEFSAEGVVEKPDVIGALFGQTEGLLGQELDLRELQRTGRIGRVEVNVDSERGKSKGKIIIPSSLDSTETVLIAATLETIERVGPCDARIKINSIEDLRSVKRKYIIERAKELLSNLVHSIPEVAIVTEELKQSVRSEEIVEYNGMPAGPDVATSDSIIICEGRADVINLLKHGIKNAVAVGGTSVPRQIGPLSKEREAIVFLDGDRGGDLILKELKQVADIDFVARAPKGKEVEELTSKELYKALREKTPADQAVDISAIPFRGQEPDRTEPKSKESGSDAQPESSPAVRIERRPVPAHHGRPEVRERHDRRHDSRPPMPIEGDDFKKPAILKRALPDKSLEFFKDQLNELIGTRAASIFDKDMKFAGRVPMKELQNALHQVDGPNTVILDGYIDAKLMSLAEEVGVKNIVGIKLTDRPRSRNLHVFSQADLK